MHIYRASYMSIIGYRGAYHFYLRHGMQHLHELGTKDACIGLRRLDDITS